MGSGEAELGLRNAPEIGAGGPEGVAEGGGGPGPRGATATTCHFLGTPAGTPHIPWLLALGLPGVCRGPVSGSARPRDGSGFVLAFSPQRAR